MYRRGLPHAHGVTLPYTWSHGTWHRAQSGYLSTGKPSLLNMSRSAAEHDGRRVLSTLCIIRLRSNRLK